MLKNKLRFNKGFTLVELLVVIVILGILATIGLASFNSSQMKGRDSKRKSDLKEVAAALELYYSDYGSYPSSDNGRIIGCPSSSVTGYCFWGSSEFTDVKTTYMKIVPGDPRSGEYFYRTVVLDSVNNQAYQLYAHLENSEDINCLPDEEGNRNCEKPNVPSVNCISGPCNFAVTSANVLPSEEGDEGAGAELQ